MQKVTENYLSKVTRYFYFVTSQHCNNARYRIYYTLSYKFLAVCYYLKLFSWDFSEPS